MQQYTIIQSFRRRSIFYINDLHQTVTQLTLAIIKSISGSHTLQDLLLKRFHNIQRVLLMNRYRNGELIFRICSLNIFNEYFVYGSKRIRTAQAKPISAQGDVQSAKLIKLMRLAAELLDLKAAMQIRHLDTEVNFKVVRSAQRLKRIDAHDQENMQFIQYRGSCLQIIIMDVRKVKKI